MLVKSAETKRFTFQYEACWRSAPGWRIIDIDSVPISLTMNTPKSTYQDYVEGRHR